MHSSLWGFEIYILKKCLKYYSTNENRGSMEPSDHCNSLRLMLILYKTSRFRAYQCNIYLKIIFWKPFYIGKICNFILRLEGIRDWEILNNWIKFTVEPGLRLQHTVLSHFLANTLFLLSLSLAHSLNQNIKYLNY